MQFKRVSCVKFVSLLVYLYHVLYLTNTQTVTWSAHPGYKVTLFEIINPINITGRGTSLTSYTSPLYTSITPANVRVFFGINGLIANGSTFQFSYKIKAYGINSTNYKFNVTLLDQTVIYRLTIMAGLIDITMPEVYFGYQQYNCKILNKGVGMRSQNISFPVSAKPNFKPNSGKITVIFFPQGVNIKNYQGLILYLGITAYYNNLTHWTITFDTQQCFVQFIHAAVIVVDRFISQNVNGYQNFYLTSKYMCPGSIYVSCPASNTSFLPPKFIDTGQAFFGLQRINFYSARLINYFLDTSNLSDLNQSFIRSGVWGSAAIGAFSIAQRQCVNSSHFFDPTTQECVPDCTAVGYSSADTINMVCTRCHYTCTTCVDDGPANCTSCSASYRIGFPNSSIPQYECRCADGHFDLDRQWCPFCSSYIFGCWKCDNETVCLQCIAGFVYTSSGKCQCNGTSLYPTTNGSCIDIIGCVAFFRNITNNTNYCTQCDIKKNFILINYTCQCIPEYTYNASVLACLPYNNTCGDGILNFNVQGCDDGNGNILDGCDILCNVQYGYECYTRLNQSSKCLPNLTQIYYIDAMKSRQSARCTLYFSLKPINNKLSSINALLPIIQTTLIQNTSFTNYFFDMYHDLKYQRYILTVSFDYSSTINPNITHNVSLYLKDDYNKTREFRRSANFTIIGRNIDFLLGQEYEKYVVLNYMIMGVVILAYVAAVIAIFKQRWIGIELVHTIQFCFFYFIMFLHIEQRHINFLEMLRLINGFNSVSQEMDYFQYITFDDKLYTLNFRKQFMMNFNITAILFCLPFVLIVCKFVVPIITKYCCQQNKNRGKGRLNKYEYKKSSQQSKPVVQKTILSQQFILGKVFVTINILFLNQIAVSFFIQQSSIHRVTQSYGHTIQQLMTLFFLTSIFIAVAIVLIGGIRPVKFSVQQWLRQQDQASFIKFKIFTPIYACLYTIFNILKISLICLLYQSSYSPYVMISLDISYLIVYCICRPYKSQMPSNPIKPQMQTQKQNYNNHNNNNNGNYNNQDKQRHDNKDGNNLQLEQQYYPIHNIHNIWNSVGLVCLSAYIILQNNKTIDSSQGVLLLRTCVFIICLVSLIFAYTRLFLSKYIRKWVDNWKTCMKENQNVEEINIVDDIAYLNKVNKSKSKNKYKKQNVLKEQLQQTSRSLQINKISQRLNVPQTLEKKQKKLRQTTQKQKQPTKRLKYVPYEKKRQLSKTKNEKDFT